MLGEQAKYPNGYMNVEVFVTKLGNDLSGIVSQWQGKRAWKFNDIVSLMRICEVMFNTAQFPQATHELRTFNQENQRKGWGALKEMETNDVPESQTSFVVNVQYRQNATWQGTIRWIDQDQEKKFRSTLELIKLMDQVIEGGQWE